MTEETVKVLVVYTGGTIGMTPADPNNPASPLRPAGKEELADYVPNPAEGIHWDIEGLYDRDGNPVGPVDSSAVGPTHWRYMADLIATRYEDYDGFVVLHGTDTMAYTGSALPFLLQNLGKPVVVTGSQLPVFKARTDAVVNFINALHIAGYKAVNVPLIPEVSIAFGDKLFRGCRTTKVSTTDWQGFESPNYPHLASFGEHILVNRKAVAPPPESGEQFFAHKDLDEKVMNFSLYPGMQPEPVKSILGLEDVEGYVLQTFGTGNAPPDEEFVEALGEAVRDKNVVVNVTQCLKGKVEMGLYEASSGLQEAGVISGLDMTAEAALAKLMWLKTQEVDPNEILVQFQVNQRGEQSQNLFDVRYESKSRKNKPVETETLSARPAGQFRKDALERAILRLSGLGLTGTDEGEDVAVGVFVNLIKADQSTETDKPQFAGYLTGQYEGEGTVLTGDITQTVRRVHEEGRPINLTLVAPEGKKLWLRGAFLSLFTDVE